MEKKGGKGSAGLERAEGSEGTGQVVAERGEVWHDGKDNGRGWWAWQGERGILVCEGMRKHRYGVGIVGSGVVALKEHLPGVRRAGGEVVALCDSVPGRAADQAEEHRVGRAYTDYHELCRDEEVDIVAVCTPSGVHREIALAALGAGKHVFMEKPPTQTAAEIREVAEASEAAGRYVLAGSHHPYRENVTALRDRIRAGELGEIYHVDCFKLRRDAIGPDDPEARGPHGITHGSTVHRIDVCLYLLGLPRVERVTARFYGHFIRQKTEAAGREYKGLAHDTVVANLQLESGATITVRDMLAAHMEEPNFMQTWFGEIRVFGSEGGAQLHPLTIYQNERDGSQRMEVPPVNNDLHEGHYPAYRYLFGCLDAGQKPEDTPERAVAVMEVIDAIYESALNGGRQVMVPVQGR